MSDQKLRGLERAASAGGLEEEVRALTERLRTGTLTQERLGMAAWLGNEAARRIVPNGATESCKHDAHGWCFTCRPILDTVRGLSEWDTDGRLGVRVAVAACLATWRALEPTHAGGPRCYRYQPESRDRPERGCIVCDGLHEPRTLIILTQAWLACPCAWHAEAVEMSGQGLGEVLRWWGHLSLAVATAQRGEKVSGARCVGYCINTLETLPTINPCEVLRNAIRDALLPSVLGAAS